MKLTDKQAQSLLDVLLSSIVHEHVSDFYLDYSDRQNLYDEIIRQQSDIIIDLSDNEKIVSIKPSVPYPQGPTNDINQETKMDTMYGLNVVEELSQCLIEEIEKSRNESHNCRK